MAGSTMRLAFTTPASFVVDHGRRARFSCVRPDVVRMSRVDILDVHRQVIDDYRSFTVIALANSQVGELEKCLRFGCPEGAEPVTFARYTAHDHGEDRTKRMILEAYDRMSA
ncbi:MAG: hypothetical protein WAX14_11145 [Rhodococcus sp. (in: high G+C Gram-positive bacteria)]|uniref:hypothetical protein n=1 Tax=Rhodococcus sp. TaxID=1831 RepID=UPI003BB5521A